MPMASNKFATKPIYQQLRDALAERISGRDWRPGHALPNEADLAREFGVSVGTVRKALDLLERERVVIRKQGRGTFVTDFESQDIASRFTHLCSPEGKPIAASISATPPREAPADEDERERLGLDADARIYRFRRICSVDGTLFMVERVVVPAALFPRLAKGADPAQQHIASLAQQEGLLLGRAQERISIRPATEAACEELGVPVGRPMLVLDRVVRALDGRPVEWRVAECLPSQLCYVAEMT